MKTAEVLVLCLVVGLSWAHKEHYAADDKQEDGVRRMDNIDTMDMMSREEMLHVIDKKTRYCFISYQRGK